jgi:hypothetical protein
LDSADYKQVLEKISGVKVATYYYNSDIVCPENGSLSIDREPFSGDSTCSKRLGLIAEEAPLEVLSADGQGVDLYKLATFTLAGVKELNSEITNHKSQITNLEARIEALEAASSASSQDANFQLALQTLGGETITLSESSITALVSNLYASVINGLQQTGLIIQQGIVKVQNLIADTLQLNKLVINTTLYDTSDPNAIKRDSTIGTAQINIGEDNTYIVNNQVTETAKIFVTPEQPVALGVCERHSQPEFVISDIKRPQGFMVCASATSSQIVKFNWWIVETIADTRGSIESPSPAQILPEQNLGGQASPSPTSTESPETSPSVSPEPSPSPSQILPEQNLGGQAPEPEIPLEVLPIE